MLKNIILIIVFLVSLSANTTPLPQSNSEYCTRFGSGPNDRTTIQDLSSESLNLMSFKNAGGLFKGGVCWWHSRFQRNILYLSIFRPDLPKAIKKNEIQNIIHQVRLGNKVFIIPGYSNFADFSADNQELILAELNDWQLYDGVILGGWLDGLKGDTSVPANVLQKKMDEVYDYVAIKKKIAYEKLQIKGITSHAWLIVDMKKTASGFDLGIIDSNNPRMTELYVYKLGDKNFFLNSYGNFVPYLEFTREEERLVQAGKEFCGMPSLKKTKKQLYSDYFLDLEEAKN